MEQEVEARQKYTEEIEAEVLILRQAGASLGRLHEEEVSELQNKCHLLEEQALKAATQHENEVRTSVCEAELLAVYSKESASHDGSKHQKLYKKATEIRRKLTI